MPIFSINKSLVYKLSCAGICTCNMQTRPYMESIVENSFFTGRIICIDTYSPSNVVLKRIATCTRR